MKAFVSSIESGAKDEDDEDVDEPSSGSLSLWSSSSFSSSNVKLEEESINGGREEQEEELLLWSTWMRELYEALLEVAIRILLLLLKGFSFFTKSSAFPFITSDKHANDFDFPLK